MNIQSTEGSYTWTKFLTLANAARVRNAGFDLPLAPVKTVSSGKRGAMYGKVNTAKRAGSFYKTNKASKNKAVLGNRFDSYA